MNENKNNFEEKFKSSSMKSTISSLLDKYKPQEKKDLKQNEIIQVLEKERDQEKNEKTRGDIDYLIQVIKNYFAKKFDAEKARQTTLQKLQEARVQEKTQEIISKNKDLEKNMQQLAEITMGINFTQQLIDKYQLTQEAQEKAKSQDGWVRKL